MLNTPTMYGGKLLSWGKAIKGLGIIIIDRMRYLINVNNIGKYRLINCVLNIHFNCKLNIIDKLRELVQYRTSSFLWDTRLINY